MAYKSIYNDGSDCWFVVEFKWPPDGQYRASTVADNRVKAANDVYRYLVDDKKVPVTWDNLTYVERMFPDPPDWCGECGDYIGGEECIHGDLGLSAVPLRESTLMSFGVTLKEDGK